MLHPFSCNVLVLLGLTIGAPFAAAQQVPAQQPNAVQTLCALLCGGAWHVNLPASQAANLKVSYVYQFDSLGTVVIGKGYFTPSRGKPWVDMHFYMMDPGGSTLRYMGISPKTGMTTGTVKIAPQRFTTILNQLHVAQLFARIVNDFPTRDRHVMTIFQSEDGFEKPSAILELSRR